MQRRPAATGMIVETFHVLHDTVGVFSDPECDAAMCNVGTATRRVALWRTRAESSRSDFVIVPLRFLDKTNSVIIPVSQG